MDWYKFQCTHFDIKNAWPIIAVFGFPFITFFLLNSLACFYPCTVWYLLWFTFGCYRFFAFDTFRIFINSIFSHFQPNQICFLHWLIRNCFFVCVIDFAHIENEHFLPFLSSFTVKLIFIMWFLTRAALDPIWFSYL